MSRKKIKTVYLFLIIIFFSVNIFSCKNNENIKKDGEKVATAVIETVKDIDLSDVMSDAEKNHLLRMDNINKLLGRDVYISKKDYYKYRDKKITLIGDSIAEGAKGILNRYFKNMHIESLAGREIETVFDVFNGLYNYGKIGDVVIISLGTNAKDGIRTDKLDKVYEKLDGRPMYILSIVMPYKGQERNRNRDIKEFVKTHNNCHLIDYNKVMKGHAEFFNEDGIHPNGLGSEVYAQILFKAIIDS